VHEGASLGVDVEIGPYSIVGPDVKIGDRTKVMPQVFLDGLTSIGADCTIFPFASIGSQTQDLKYKVGNKTYVEIGDRTTLREYVTINSGTMDGEVTKVGTNSLIMAYCHVAHGCKVGNRVIMANNASLSGDVLVEDDVVIGGMIPGPYTLLLLIVDVRNMFIEMKKEPQAVTDALFHLSSFLVEIGAAYKNAGVDFITIHDMGGSPAFIGPSKYEQFVFPAEKFLIEKLPKPRVLSVCGNVTSSLHLLAQTGADALSLDQTVDLVAARLILKDTLLFGNLDPVETLYRGDPVQVAKSVIRAKEAGVDAIWPGCDLVIRTPIQNIKALIV
jgi:carbonic anhydrase/acetyltransferase-like protein (isoleucine patch superfamily)